MIHRLSLVLALTCSQSLFASYNLDEASHRGVMSKHNEMVFESQYYKQITAGTISPRFFLQTLVNDLLVYTALEETITERSTLGLEAFTSKTARKEALERDIEFLEAHFNLHRPFETKTAKKLAKKIRGASDLELKVAYYALVSGLLDAQLMQPAIKKWLEKHNLPEGACEFYHFDLGDQSNKDFKSALKEFYKKIPLSKEQYQELFFFAKDVFMKEITSYDEGFWHPYITRTPSLLGNPCVQVGMCVCVCLAGYYYCF